jgi:RND family efflux transporter MFP subunit
MTSTTIYLLVRSSYRGLVQLNLVALTLLCLCHSFAADIASCPGITEPVFDVTLSLPVPGIVSALNFKPGDFVHTNDVILELDNQLEQIEIERRKCIMENHKADWESTRTVFEKSASISRDELLKKEADYKVSLAEYQEAEEQLRRRRLIAPGAGILCEMKLHVGEACSPYEAVVRLVDTRHCHFISDIPARASGRLKTGQTVQLEIENGDTPIPIEGRIIFISPVVDSASGLQTVKVLFENPDGKVRPGLAGKIILREAKP